MRLKISFLKVHGSSGMVPLHHQRIISAFMEEVIQELQTQSKLYNFSSLKGTSKVMQGQIRFLSSKVSLVISAPEEDFVREWVKRIFDRRLVAFAKLSLVPKSYQVMTEATIQTVMKYVCISPLVPDLPFINTGEPPPALDPSSQSFSDLVFNHILDRMEKAGYTEEQLNQYAEFELTPDPQYMQKVQDMQKKFSRIYKNNDNETIHGYLLPFTLHAHPDVQKFVWQSGIGLYTTQGFGMLDTVPESAPTTDVLVP
jgi:CRISPR-associated endoribonuclease Cas6